MRSERGSAHLLSPVPTRGERNGTDSQTTHRKRNKRERALALALALPGEGGGSHRVAVQGIAVESAVLELAGEAVQQARGELLDARSIDIHVLLRDLRRQDTMRCAYDHA